MRVLQISGTAEGGSWFVDQVTELARRGHQVSVVVPGAGSVEDRLIRAGIPVEVLPFRGYRPRHWRPVLAARERLARLARSGAYDIVHAHLLKAVVVARLAVARAPVPLVSQMPGTAHLESRPLAAVDRATLRLDTVLLASCREFGRTYSALGAPFVRVNHYGCHTELFDPATDRAPFRAEYGVPDDVVAIGLIGHMYPTRLKAFRDVGVKGHETFIDAAAKLRQRRTDLRFFVVGDEFAGDGRYRAELEARASRAGLTGSMYFTGHRHDIPSVVAGLDILVNPSLSESASYTMIEGSLMRRPVIGSAVGGLLDTIVDGVTGLLVPPADPAALAAAVDRLASDAELRVTLGAAGRKHVRELFDISHTVDVLEEVYDEAVSRARRHERGSNSGAS